VYSNFPANMLRSRQAELMDDPALDPARHRGALEGLARINRWSDSVSIVWEPIKSLAATGAPLRVLDLATGGGDIPIGLWGKARRSGLQMQFNGCDVSPVAVDYARQAAQRAGAEVEFFQADVLSDDLPEEFDVITTSLFVHHLEAGQVVNLFKKMAQTTRRLMVVNDLVRSPAALGLAFIGTRLLTRSGIVHVDGPRSVRGAYTLAEIADLAREAGLSGFSLRPRFPCRYLLTWSPP
jgi:2-polyprenyl-3-methyl-5-hydroxy-6-metoxy-1,4-benzoquinol methylase